MAKFNTFLPQNCVKVEEAAKATIVFLYKKIERYVRSVDEMKSGHVPAKIDA
jgi:hypothetical protein